METQLLRVTDAAKIAGIGRTFAYEMVNSGQWPSVRLGRAVRIPTNALKAWIAEREREADERAAELRGESIASSPVAAPNRSKQKEVCN